LFIDFLSKYVNIKVIYEFNQLKINNLTHINLPKDRLNYSKIEVLSFLINCLD